MFFPVLTTGIEDVDEVLAALDAVDCWVDLGHALGLQTHTLEGLNSKKQMLMQWLNQLDGCFPSWAALVEALRSVQCHDVARQIEQRYSHKY